MHLCGIKMLSLCYMVAGHVRLDADHGWHACAAQQGCMLTSAAVAAALREGHYLIGQAVQKLPIRIVQILRALGVVCLRHSAVHDGGMVGHKRPAPA